MIEKLIATILIAGIWFMVGEWLRRRLHESNEASRKLVHVIHGLLIASWPFVLGEAVAYPLIIIVEIGFLLTALAARRLRLFRWMWRVGRRSGGEWMYPLGIIAVTLLAESRWIFLAAVLILALADSTAALVGKNFGKGNRYKVFGERKSVAGSAAFVLVAYLVILVVAVFGMEQTAHDQVLTALILALGLMSVENMGIYGSDNLTLPITSVLFLNFLY